MGCLGSVAYSPFLSNTRDPAGAGAANLVTVDSSNMSLANAFYHIRKIFLKFEWYNSTS